MAGSYNGTAVIETEETQTGSTTRTEQKVTSADVVDVISGETAMSSWVTVGPCGAVPATWSGASLNGEDGYECEDVTTYSTGGNYTQTSKFDSFVVRSTGPGAIEIEGEWTLEGKSSSTPSTVTTRIVKYSFTGTRIAGN